MTKKEIEEVIFQHISEHNHIYEGMDWWTYDENFQYNIHNVGQNDPHIFNLDRYAFDKVLNQFDHSKWDIIKIYNINDYKGKNEITNSVLSD